MNQFEHLSVTDATEVSLAAASHLTEADAGAVATLRALADRIDQGDARDNVSIPTYLKFCEALGLTPASRMARSSQTPKPAVEAGPATGLSKFRVVG